MKKGIIMKKFMYDEKICNGWKSYPIRVTLSRPSKCHQNLLILVQSMEGGFVNADCFKCGKKETITEDEFKNLPLICCCPKCKKIMKSEMIDKNYCYTCQDCDLYIRLADVLPHWADLK